MCTHTHTHSVHRGTAVPAVCRRLHGEVGLDFLGEAESGREAEQVWKATGAF